MRQFFDNSTDLDLKRSNALIESTKKSQMYTAREAEMIKIGMSRFSVFDGAAKHLKMPSPSVSAKINDQTGASAAFGYATGTVRASAERVFAYYWDVDMRCSTCLSKRASAKLFLLVVPEPASANNMMLLMLVLHSRPPSLFICLLCSLRCT